MLVHCPKTLILLCFKKYRYLTSSFERPGFREMEALIEAGKVSAVIVKDLSRFGREHVETSRYLEIIYPT